MQTHGLDTSSAALLEQQAPDIQLRLMQEFLPKPGTKNANGLFAAFVRSMSSAPGKGAQLGKGAQMYTSQAKGAPRTEDLIAFLQTHGLDTSSTDGRPTDIRRTSSDGRPSDVRQSQTSDGRPSGRPTDVRQTSVGRRDRTENYRMTPAEMRRMV